MAPRFPDSQNKGKHGSTGFTLVEMLTSIAVLAVIILLASEMIGSTEKLYKNTTAKIDSFRDARVAFEMMTDQLRQATVNTYYDYFDSTGRTLEQFNATNAGASTGAFTPVSYGRQSELHFISGPVNGTATSTASGSSVGPKLTLSVPGGGQVVTDAVFFQYPQAYTDVVGNPASANSGYGILGSLLNATGFFVEFGPEVVPPSGAWSANSPPALITAAPTFQPTYRFRLMQFIQPTEYLAIYTYSTTTGTGANDWFNLPITSSHVTNVRMVADNIIALIICPKETDSPTDTLAPAYIYDSRMGATSGSSPWKPSSGLQPLQMNQMPPILRVAMVALDEPSAKVLQGTSTTLPASISSAMASSNPNTGASLFSNSQNMDSDLTYLQTELEAIKPHLNYRVFNTTIAVRSAKFSSLGQ
jgi:uncharacterized protein (TIGR02599 family)